jgi:predicted metal-dependent hydrolase
MLQPSPAAKEPAMQVRYPTFDTSRFRAHWAPNPEFAQSYNAFSVVPAHIEPYLVKVIMRARKVVPQHEQELQRDMEIFIRQEVQHNKQHLTFNQALYDAGYAGMQAIEAEYKAEYHRFLSTRSLKFNLAYCEGFEAIGCASGELWFNGGIDPLIEGADPYAVELWKWHLAEEFEHRTVCFDAFKTLYGKGLWNSIVNGYFYRLYGFFYATWHIGKYTARCEQYLLDQDRAKMSAAEQAESRTREKQMRRTVFRATLPLLLKVLSPFYNPRRKAMPDNMAQLLARYAAMGQR